jgi:hypothetical protein
VRAKLEPRLNDLPAVRGELEAIYYCAKSGVIPQSVAGTCTTILKALGALLKDERELDIEEQLAELRSAINQLKGDTDGQMAA